MLACCNCKYRMQHIPFSQNPVLCIFVYKIHVWRTKEPATFTQLVKVRGGSLVLTHSKVRFSRNFQQSSLALNSKYE